MSARIDHAALYVLDLAAARDFFVTYLDAEAGAEYHNPRTSFRSVFLRFAGGTRLELMNRPELSGGPSEGIFPGWQHLAFSLGSAEAVDALTARLSAAGYGVLSGPRTTGDGYYESAVCAVEGNLIELTV